MTPRSLLSKFRHSFIPPAPPALPALSEVEGSGVELSGVEESLRPRRFISAKLCAPLCLCVIFSFLLSTSAAQDLDKPLQNIDDEITAFTFAPDGRIAYGVRHNIKTKKYDLQHDDLWLMETGGKRRRLVQGDKFSRGDQLFSYAADGFSWSPNGRYLLAQLFTTTVTDESGRTDDSSVALALEENGKEVHLGKGESVIKDCYKPSFLLDNATIVYLTEAVKPRMLFSFRYTNINTGPVGPIFEGRTFIDYVRIPNSNAALAVERDRAMSGPPRLQRLELLAQDDKEVATLDGYEGGLSLSPSGKKIAYFIDREVLEVRDLTMPDHFARLRVGLGLAQWSPDESRILLKRAVERKSGDIVWITLPALPAQRPGQPMPVSEPTPRPILHGVTFRDMAVSPDGRFLAVVAPGRRNLLLFPMPN